MKKTFRDVDFEALASFWNGFYPGKFKIDAEILRLNTVQAPSFDWGASAIETTADNDILGFVIVKRSPAGLYPGPDMDRAHLSAIGYLDGNTGVDLFAEAKNILINRGNSQIVYGQDSRHFFPGCPGECRGLCDYLMIEGFQSSGESHDVERDLGDYVNPFPNNSGHEMRLLSEQDIPNLEQFLRREFPGRWTYDVLTKMRAEAGAPCVFGLLIDGAVHGFALIQNGSHKLPIGGAVWRNDLGENWGSLGPIGVSKSLRGQGLGNSLLGSALEYLRDIGTRRCIIDWTGLVDFYGGHGFQIARTYTSRSLRLGE